MRKTGLLGARLISSDQLGAVCVRVVPCSINKYEEIQIALVDRKTRGAEVVVELLTGSSDVANVAPVAEEIARLLNLPLVVLGMSRQVPQGLASWLARNQTRIPAASRAK